MLRLVCFLSGILPDGVFHDFYLAGALCACFVFGVLLTGAAVHKLVNLEIDFLSKCFPHKAVCLFVNRITFIGTILHEYAHAAAASLFGAKVHKIKCFTFEDGVLGYVKFSTRGGFFRRSMQLGFSSCAPVFIGMIVCEAALFFQTSVWWQRILCFYAFISTLQHMGMSRQDRCNFYRSLPVMLPFLFAAFFLVVNGLRYFGFLL